MNVGPRDRGFAPDRWPTHARVCKPEGYCSQTATLISFFPRFRKTLSEKKRRRPVVVLEVLRVLKVLGVRKTALALGFKTFWCTDMGLLVCSYGRSGAIRCTDMGTSKHLKLKEFFIWCTDVGTFGVQLRGIGFKS